MTPNAPLSERIDLTRADDLRDVVHRAVACLAQGGLIGLPTESEYTLAASALRPEAVARLQSIQENAAAGKPLALVLKSAEEIADWVPGLATHGRKLARRAWPGPVLLAFDGQVARGLLGHLPAVVRNAVAAESGQSLSLRSPAHPVVREILRLIPGPIVLASPSGNGQAVTQAEPLLRMGTLDMVLDDGPIARGGLPTVVRIDQESWRVEQVGVVAPEQVRRLAGTLILFVCTGNTCRSPMAEALCKKLLAQKRGCAVDELEASGFVVLSAGIAAAEGMPAAANAIEVIGAMGGSLAHHQSRRLTPELVAHADQIVTMTRDHYDVLVTHVPEAAPRTRLLHARGEDIDDPVGLDRETYKRTANEIEAHLRTLVDALVEPI